LGRIQSYGVMAAAAAGGVVACAPVNSVSQADFSPVYNGVETQPLGVGLVNIRVSMQGARDNKDVANYADCAVAQYAMLGGFGFARHVRTNVVIEGGIWRGDAVYTVSPTLPQGLRTIDAEVTVQNCATEAIPTV